MEEAGTVWRSLGHFFYVVDNEPATCEENGDEMEECKRCYRLRKARHLLLCLENTEKDTSIEVTIFQIYPI